MTQFCPKHKTQKVVHEFKRGKQFVCIECRRETYAKKREQPQLHRVLMQWLMGAV